MSGSNSQFSVNKTNSHFNLVYTLNQQQKNDTIVAFPNGFYYLSDNTDNINLGNNTIVQNDYNNINVTIANMHYLIFSNRFVPSLGTKNLNIKFNVGAPNYNSFDVQGTNFTYNATTLTQPYYAQNNIINLTERTSKFNLVYTLTQTQINETIGRYPQGIFYLKNDTDNIKLGNNTIVQNDYNNINVTITNTNQLVFNNRFIPSTGTKTLSLNFNVGPPYYYDDNSFSGEKTFTYNSEILQNNQNNQNNSTICIQS